MGLQQECRFKDSMLVAPLLEMLSNLGNSESAIAELTPNVLGLAFYCMHGSDCMLIMVAARVRSEGPDACGAPVRDAGPQ